MLDEYRFPRGLDGLDQGAIGLGIGLVQSVEGIVDGLGMGAIEQPLEAGASWDSQKASSIRLPEWARPRDAATSRSASPDRWGLRSRPGRAGRRDFKGRILQRQDRILAEARATKHSPTQWP